MADGQNIEDDDALVDQPEDSGADVDMAEDAGATGGDASELPFAEGGEAEPVDTTPRVTFMSYLTSPIVTLVVGQGDNTSVLTAHQSLLVQSPWFAQACEQFVEDGRVSPHQAPQILHSAENKAGARLRNLVANVLQRPTRLYSMPTT